MDKKPITDLKGVGPAVAEQLALVGIRTVADLLDYLPRTHHDFSEVTPIDQAMPGTVTVKAQFVKATGRYLRRAMHITEASAMDETGAVRCIWFNQPYRADSIKIGHPYYITGKLEFKQQRFSITNPHIELVSETPVHTARIIPVYRETR